MIDIFCRVSERRREEQNNCQVRFPSSFREVVSSQSHNARNDKYHEGISEILPRGLMSIRNALAALADWAGEPKSVKGFIPMKASGEEYVHSLFVKLLDEQGTVQMGNRPISISLTR